MLSGRCIVNDSPKGMCQQGRVTQGKQLKLRGKTVGLAAADKMTTQLAAAGDQTNRAWLCLVLLCVSLHRCTSCPHCFLWAQTPANPQHSTLGSCQRRSCGTWSKTGGSISAPTCVGRYPSKRCEHTGGSASAAGRAVPGPHQLQGCGVGAGCSAGGRYFLTHMYFLEG